eukprot:TRINITY_DN57931_c0_g1_i1.p1 TRINITY_DN57931_c0_g1~~TRINITY_DN57931_c0_g1_i1.p1  ORF type:complete len:295 (+),score=61.45 TRINITY_DN57931_c0_g1_i1:115-999(+)
MGESDRCVIRLEHLSKQLSELQESVAKVQIDARKRVADVTQKAIERHGELEARLEKLEYELQTSVKANEKALDGLSQRVTELGVEVAEMPEGKHIHVALERLERAEGRIATLHTASDAHTAHFQEVKTALTASCEHLIARITSTFEGLVVRADAADKQTEGLAVRVESVERGVTRCQQDDETAQRRLEVASEELREDCRRDIERSQEFCRVENRRSLDALTAMLLGETGDLSASTPGGQLSLAARVSAAERRIDSLARCKAEREEVLRDLASKAELAHTHDRLVSTDGSVTFAL